MFGTWVWAGAVVLSVAGACLVVICDSDLGYHLATGRAVLERGAIPATNILSYTNPDYPWLLHQWLPAVLFERAWHAGGPAGATLLKTVVICATWLFVFLTAVERGSGGRLAAAGTLVGAGASAFHFSERPMVFTHLGLAVVAYLLTRFERATDHVWRWVAGAAFVAALSWQFHAGGIFIWLAMLAWAVGAAIEPLRAKWARSPALQPHGMRTALTIAALLLASIAVTGGSLALYHPHGVRVLWVPFTMASNDYLTDHLIEFGTLWRFPASIVRMAWVVLVLTGVVMVARIRHIHAAWLLCLAGFTLLSLRHVRVVYSLAIVAAPFLGWGALPWIERLGRRTRAVVSSAMAAILIATIPLDQWSRIAPGFGLSEAVWPTHIFRFVEQHHLRGPVYASDGWAGPFLGWFYPQERSFFDPRIEAYPFAFLKDVYQHIRYGEPGWRRLLDQYGVELVILKYSSTGELRQQHGNPNLRQRLAADPDWALVYFDDVGMIYVRRTGPNAPCARTLHIPAVDPDRLAFQGDPRVVREGLVAARLRGNDSSSLATLLSRVESEIQHAP